MADCPFAGSWWVVPGQLLAGRYPGDPSEATAEAKLTGLLDAGIRTAICLQEEGEMGTDGLPFVPYVGRLIQLAEARGIAATCLRIPIRDGHVPDAQTMESVLETIDASLDEERPVYVHCWGGHGRTGTVIGCWLVRHGMAGEEALSRVAELHEASCILTGIPAPETAAQRGFVLRWAERRA